MAPGCAKKVATRRSSDLLAQPEEAHAMSSTKRLIPMEPKGTRPNSIFPPESFSHSELPTPMPKLNAHSKRVETAGPAPSVSFAKGANWESRAAPKNQSQLMPRSDKKTARCPLSDAKLRQVSLTG